MSQLERKVAFVTGGGNGIGAALARALADRRYKVAVTDIDVETARAVAEDIVARGGMAISLKHDVTRPQEWAEAVARAERELGPIDFLASNAGVAGSMRPLEKVSADYLRWLLEVNLISALHAIHTVVPGMRARKSGQVLFTGSLASVSAGGGNSEYCMSKHALLAMAAALRDEAGPDGVQVSLLAPASVESKLAATTRKILPQALEKEALFDSDEKMQSKAASSALLGGRISAEEAIRLTLHQMDRGGFLIFTHPKSRIATERRGREVADGFDLLDAALRA